MSNVLKNWLISDLQKEEKVSKISAKINVTAFQKWKETMLQTSPTDGARRCGGISKELNHFGGIASFFRDWAPGTLTFVYAPPVSVPGAQFKKKKPARSPQSDLTPWILTLVKNIR